MECVVCTSNCRTLFDGTLMQKYPAKYYKCAECGIVQTEPPYWLDQAYKKAITDLDIGLLSRNINLSEDVFRLIVDHFDIGAKFLDFGGGYGILVRLLRDKGLNFYRQDIYCENIFAVNFDIEDLNKTEHSFELVTCFEVLEHTSSPLDLFDKIREYSSNILFTTLLLPESELKSTGDWWYFAPETGQHVTFYTIKALSIIAKKFNMHLYSNGENMHLFTNKPLNKNPLIVKNNIKNKIKFALLSYFNSHPKGIASLTEHDVDVARKKSWTNNL